MYSETSDRLHYLKRTGSHATKPHSNGLVNDIPDSAIQEFLRDLTGKQKRIYSRSEAKDRNRIIGAITDLRSVIRSFHDAPGSSRNRRQERHYKRLLRALEVELRKIARPDIGR